MENILVKDTKKSLWAQVLKGVLISVSFTLVAILLFALVIKYVGITENLISPINQVIKVVSIFFGTYFALKKDCSKGLVKGLFIGVLYTALAYILFAALSRSLNVNLTLLNDILFGMIIGAICGVIVVNLKRKN